MANSLSAAEIDRAFGHLYAFEFQRAHATLDLAEENQRNRALLHAARAAVYLFSEMERLGILASDFYRDRGEKLRRKDFSPSPAVRERLFASLTEARDLALERLEESPQDAEAHFSLALAAGVECNYAVFVEKQRMSALSLARESHRHALNTLKADPEFRDAHLVTGLNEYVIGSLPFFLRWFISFENVEGDKDLAVEVLEDVSRSGRYLDTFAKMLLATIHIREKRWEAARQVTSELAAEFPGNELFRRELERLTAKTSAG